MIEIKYKGENGYFLSEEEYQSMIQSYNKIETLLMKMGGMVE